MTFARRLEVARVVKNVVFRQQSLVGKADQLLIADKCRGVEEPTARETGHWAVLSPTIAV